MASSTRNMEPQEPKEPAPELAQDSPVAPAATPAPKASGNPPPPAIGGSDWQSTHDLLNIREGVRID